LSNVGPCWKRDMLLVPYTMNITALYSFASTSVLSHCVLRYAEEQGVGEAVNSQTQSFRPLSRSISRDFALAGTASLL